MSLHRFHLHRDGEQNPKTRTLLPRHLTAFSFILDFQKSHPFSIDHYSKKKGHRFTKPSNFVKSAEVSFCCSTSRYFQRVSQKKIPNSRDKFPILATMFVIQLNKNCVIKRCKLKKLEIRYVLFRFSKTPAHNKKSCSDSLLPTADRKSLP